MPDASGLGYTEEEGSPPLRVWTMPEMIALQLPPRELILGPWLPVKGLGMIYGPRGIGKTYVALGCAYAIATGGSFLRWHASKERRVLVIDAEMNPAVQVERMHEIAAAGPTKLADLHNLRVLSLDLLGRSLNLADHGAQLEIAPLLADVDVIFVDNISTLAQGGPENDSESWTPIQEWALTQKRAGRSVVFIHHANKKGDQRGSSRREDVLDTVIALQRPNAYRPEQTARFNVHYEKSRGFYGDDARPFEAALTNGKWLTREISSTRDGQDDREARAMELIKAGRSLREIEKELGIPKTTLQRKRAKAQARASARAPKAG